MKVKDSFLKSEFEQILSAKLGPDTSTTTSQSNSPLKNNPKSTEAFFTEDFLTSFYFSYGKVKIRVFSEQEEKRAEFKREAHKKAEAARASEELKQTTSRSRRKFTFDQERAVKVFLSFGELTQGDLATDQEIKIAYRRLALRFHPDAHQGQGDAEAFKKISAAYQLLIK